MTPEQQRQIAGYLKRGWYPAKWAHHPPEVKACIRRTRWRPGIKECFANCQRFVILSELRHYKYHEGVATDHDGFRFHHAWLVYEGRVLELTLPDASEVEYCAYIGANTEQVAKTVVSRGEYAPLLDPAPVPSPLYA